jgi:hypothetical protein
VIINIDKSCKKCKSKIGKWESFTVVGIWAEDQVKRFEKGFFLAAGRTKSLLWGRHEPNLQSKREEVSKLECKSHRWEKAFKFRPWCLLDHIFLPQTLKSWALFTSRRGRVVWFTFWNNHWLSEMEWLQGATRDNLEATVIIQVTEDHDLP